MRRRSSRGLRTHNDIIDGDMNELDKEPNEAHNPESNRRGHGNLLEL